MIHLYFWFIVCYVTRILQHISDLIHNSLWLGHGSVYTHTYIHSPVLFFKLSPHDSAGLSQCYVKKDEQFSGRCNQTVIGGLI